MIRSSSCPPWRPEPTSDPTEDRRSYTTPGDVTGDGHQGAAARRLEWIQPQGSDALLPTRTHPFFLSSTTTDVPAATTLVEGAPRSGSARTLAPVVVTIRFITGSEVDPRTSEGVGANDIGSPRSAGSLFAVGGDLTTVVLPSGVGTGGCVNVVVPSTGAERAAGEDEPVTEDTAGPTTGLDTENGIAIDPTKASGISSAS